MATETVAENPDILRTPLKAIVGFSELLLTETPDPLTERQRRYVEHIVSAAKHLQVLIDDLSSS